MSARNSSKDLERRIERDQRNAEMVARAAEAELVQFRRPAASVNSLHGATRHDRSRIDYAEQRRLALESIAADPFQVMVEVYTEVLGGGGKEQLWYANQSSSVNEVFNSEDRRIPVLSWTHPGIQLALSTELGDYSDVRANGLLLKSVEPLAKARFDCTLPQISAVYHPGGAVRQRQAPAQKAGLKAVKLDMTRDQVKAFVSRMSGLMIVTGAPGSGKTTVAFQRIRFLFDQQDQREGQGRMVPYKPELTRIFLANQNLADQARNLLSTQLDIPTFIVEGVDAFVDGYLEQAWVYKHNARPRQRRLAPLEIAARTAILGLSDHHDLGRLWEVYERQIGDRLQGAETATWVESHREGSVQLKALAGALARHARNTTARTDPLRSEITMDATFAKVSRVYEAARESMPAPVRTKFDEEFQHWLYSVYDPLSALAAYFGQRQSEGAYRMRSGTAARVNEAEVLENAISEWGDRVYGPEDRPWLAWLLRFALPAPTDSQVRFREMPSSLAPATSGGERWTHVVMDEAQDLCVAEASLIGSLVDPDGALTVSADFRQIVSPVHGMKSAAALGVGRSLRGKGAEQIYPFARNMRQSKQIGRFLQAFHEVAFNERATFEVNTGLEDKKPQLIIAPPQDHALRIKQVLSVLRRSEVVTSVALLQINEDEQALARLRTDLEGASVVLAPLWASTGNDLLTTSVERIKGLEFDACIVLGLEEVETSALNFTLNRAYVALSRPARRLVLICSEYPPLLRRVDKALFDVTQS